MGLGKYYRIYVRSCEYGRQLGQQRWTAATACGCPACTRRGVLCDAEGRPVGVTCLDEIDLGPGGPVWRGKDILADPGISDEQQRQLEEKIEKEFAKNIYEVRIMPRPEPQEEEELDFGGRSDSGGGYPGQQAVEEMLVYGLGFAENKLLIPEALPKELVAGIDTITVRVGDEDRARPLRRRPQGMRRDRDRAAEGKAAPDRRLPGRRQAGTAGAFLGRLRPRAGRHGRADRVQPLDR